MNIQSESKVQNNVVSDSSKPNSCFALKVHGFMDSAMSVASHGNTGTGNFSAPHGLQRNHLNTTSGSS